jgi:uncharacterized protein (DUF1330 family)
VAAYIVANYRITNAEAYEPYPSAAVPILTAYGGELLVADFESEVTEGQAGPVTVVLRFPSMDAARTFYASPEYQEVISLRTDNTEGFLAFTNEFVMPG